LTQRENEASVVEMERDSLGLVVREVVNGRAVDLQYDASGNRTERTSSLGARVVMSRDGLGPAGAPRGHPLRRDGRGCPRDQIGSGTWLVSATLRLLWRWHATLR
jgi:hypothetical protein